MSLYAAEKPKIDIITSTARGGRFGGKPIRWILATKSERADLDLSAWVER